MEEWFLDSNRGARGSARAADRPFAVREGVRVTPLLLAAEMFPEMERRVLAARNRVFLAFRVFDPQTRTRSDEARGSGLRTWGDILKARLADGVTIRVLLSDFEPTVAHRLHAGSWATFQALKEMNATLEPDEQERFEIIVSQHPGEVGWGIRQLVRLPVGLALRRLMREFRTSGNDPEALLAVRPGLWRYYRVTGQGLHYRRRPAPRLWPATHHQKFAVFDDRVAIVGGLDVDERRWETRRYRQPAPETWHDVSVLVEGPAASDAAEHFRRLWNDELPRFKENVRYWLDGAERELVVEPLDAMPEPVAEAATVAGGGRAQMLRTLSRRSRHLFAVGPSRHVRELMQAHRALIFAAQRTLYIEAQFFRSWRAAGWVKQAARRNPALQVIVLLPQAPEEVAFGGDVDNPAHRHGEWMQARAIGRMRRALGPRLGLFSLGKQLSVDGAEEGLAATRGAAFGAGMIYVHSKLLLADDRLALVSSANINGRSFGWDSEFGILWQDSGTVAALRAQLWAQLLGVEQKAVAGFGLADWRRVAEANVHQAPEQRQGFVLPYRYARVRRFGRPAWFVPDDLV